MSMVFESREGGILYSKNVLYNTMCERCMLENFLG